VKRQPYKGEPFAKVVYARKIDDGDDGLMSEFWDSDGPGGMLDMDAPTWVATYRLVGVRKIKRTVKVVRAR
jgi:hypothetical protein